jgi:hypothetical protein
VIHLRVPFSGWIYNLVHRALLDQVHDNYERIGK